MEPRVDESRSDDGGALVPFVPRLTIEWLRDAPERRWQALEGTLAFVDVSGFTAMSERLARHGRLGAEQVTEVMNAVFAALLEEAYAYGGGLLKFGGDALLLLFDGEGHAPRAARAAARMRHVLRTSEPPPTAAGAVALRMHVGMHAGTHHFFLVGDSHRELLVVGPGATRTVEMEAASRAGEILLSPETAALLDARARGEERDGGVLLRSAPDAEERPAPLQDARGLPLARALPATVRSELTLGPLEGEHRHAAIAFVRFSGTDALVAEQGPDAVADALEGLVSTLQAAADVHGVTFLESDVDRDGGRIVLVAGAPRTTGEDEEALLRTVRAAVDAGGPLPLHVGASRGRIFAGQVGARFRRTYTVLGDTAALAARLMARAGAGEILVADDVLERARSRFHARACEPLALKGRAAPVRASVLGERIEQTQAPEPPAGTAQPFVGRARELAVLQAAVGTVGAGFGSLVELVGEPGLGKSRLVAELERLCAGMTILSSACDPYGTATPYRGVRDLLRTVLDAELGADAGANREALAARLAEVDPALVPWVPLLAAPLNVPIEPTREVEELQAPFRRARLHGVVAAFLAGALPGPTLLVFEDVHWMDEASVDLLRHLAAQVSSRPWLTCVTRRAVEGGFSPSAGPSPLPALTLRLEPLAPEDARELVRAAAGGRALGDAELDALAARGGGNPLFLRELAAEAGGGDGAELPESVEAIVDARIDRLEPRDRTLMRWASVLGMSFSGSIVEAVLADDPSVVPDDAAWARLAEFVERDPDVPGSFRFRHALIRDAAYEGLSIRRRRQLHGRVAAVAEERYAGRTGEVAELLSLHFDRAGRPDGAWRHSLAAGGRAREKGANADAALFYRRALDAARSLPELPPSEVAAAWEALGDCLRLAGSPDEAAQAFAAARRLLPPDGTEQVSLMRKEGALRAATGRYADALRWYTRALKLADALPDEAERTRHRLRLRLRYAQVRFRQGAFRECIRRLRDVVDEGLAAGDLETLAPAYMTLHTAFTHLGLPERAAFRGLALPLFEELGDLRGQATALNNLGIEAYYEGDWERALDLYERAAGLFERVGDVASLAMARNNVGEILSDQGRDEEADRLFADAERISAAAGERPLAAVARANRGRSAARAGRLDEGEELLTEALETFRELRSAGFVRETAARLAEVDLLRGDRPEAALARLAPELDGAAPDVEAAGGRATALRLEAAARLQLGDPASAGPLLEEAVEVARGSGALLELGLALDLRAAALDDEAAGAEGAELLRRLGVQRVSRAPLEPVRR